MTAGKWTKGQSGNPNGRKPGTGKVSKLRESLGRGLPKIIAKLKAQALAGDVQAARLLLERVIPPLKPEESPASFNLPEGDLLIDQARAVLLAAGGGDLTVAQAAQLLGGLGTMAKIAEVDEMQQRIAALERAVGAKEGT